MKRTGFIELISVIFLLLVTTDLLHAQNTSGKESTSNLLKIVEAMKEKNENLPSFHCRRNISIRANFMKEQELSTYYMYGDLVYGKDQFLMERNLISTYKKQQIYTITSTYREKNKHLFTFKAQARELAYISTQQFHPGGKITFPSGMIITFDFTQLYPNLFALNVYPKLLSPYRKTASIVDERENDGSFIEIKLNQCREILNNTIDASWTLFFDPETKRIVKFQVQPEDQNPFQGRVTKWQTFHGVQLPERISLELQGPGGKLHENFTNLKRPNPDKEQPIKPRWTQDPAIPGPTSVDFETLKNRLSREDPGPEAFLQFANEYVNQLGLQFFGSGKLVNPLASRLEKAVSTYPDSRVLREYLGVMRYQQNKMKQLSSLVNTKSGHAKSIPFLHFLLASRGQNQNDPDLWQKRINRLRENDLYRLIGKRLALRNEVRNTSTADEFLKLLTSYRTENTTAGNLNVISVLAPPLFKQDDSSGWLFDQSNDFLQNVREKTTAPDVSILLARAYARKRNFEQAVDIYQALDDRDVPKRERILYSHFATRNEAILPPDFLSVLSSLKMLHQQILLQIEEKETGNVEKGMRRLNEILNILNRKRFHEDTDVPRFLRHGDGPTQVRNILTHLMDRDRKELARAYVEQLVQYYPDLFNHEEELLETVNALFDENNEEIYDIARYMSGGGWDNYLTREQVFQLFKKRSGSGDVQRSEYRLLAAATQHYFYHREEKHFDRIHELLKKGTEQYPEDFLILERLADVQFALEQYRDARENYQKWLTMFRRTEDQPDPIPRTLTTLKSVVVNFDMSFRTERPVPVKLFRTYRKTDQQDRGVSELITFAEKQPDVNTIKICSKVLKEIGQAESIPRLLKLGFTNFQKDRDQEAGAHEFTELTNQLLDLLQEQEKFMEAAVVADIAIETKKKYSGMLFTRDTSDLEERKNKLLGKVDKNAILNNELERYTETPPEERRSKAEKWIGQLEKDSYTKRKRAKEELQKIAEDIVPVLKEHRHSGGPEKQSTIEMILKDVVIDDYKSRFEKNTNPKPTQHPPVTKPIRQPSSRGRQQQRNFFTFLPCCLFRRNLLIPYPSKGCEEIVPAHVSGPEQGALSWKRRCSEFDRTNAVPTAETFS